MKFKSLGGLTVKDGRLINDRPAGVSGIQRAADLARTMKRSKEVDIIADGIELSKGHGYDM